jgi:hypothetical protein
MLLVVVDPLFGDRRCCYDARIWPPILDEVIPCETSILNSVPVNLSVAPGNKNKETYCTWVIPRFELGPLAWETGKIPLDLTHYALQCSMPLLEL